MLIGLPSLKENNPISNSCKRGSSTQPGKQGQEILIQVTPSYHQNRREQTMIFRLRTGHCRLGAHLYKLEVVTAPQYQEKHLLTTQNNGRKTLGRKRRPTADCGVCGGSKHHDLNSSIHKLNAEEEEEEEKENYWET